ncbi:MAG: nuclear transport factor 2 family protein [Planctomycetes bacterium]|nr:nuclear transport factor 2 family protein [Planctomycetota bacterium]
MTWINEKRSWLGAFAIVLGLAAALVLATQPETRVHAQGAGKKGQKKGDPKSAAKEDQSPDRDAIKKSVQSFIVAVERGDAKALAAQWTENGEYISDDGTVLRGRDSIEKEYAAQFAKKGSKVKLEVDVDSIRFPSKDTAIEEGYFTAQRGDNPSTTSKYSVLHVREGGKWLMAVVREWPNDGASIRDLDWLIGAWEAKRADAEVHSTYEWWGNKTFIRVHFTIKKKEQTTTGFQMIARDAATGQLRSWAFDVDGSFGEATWEREGKKWVQDSAGVLSDGRTMSATNIITRLDSDAFTFQSVQRSVGGESLPDIPPVRVSRVKSKE